MGIPIWKPTKHIQQPIPHSPSLQQQDQQHSTIRHRNNTEYRIHRGRRAALLAEPYYTAATDRGYTTPTSTATTNALQPTEQSQSYPQYRHQTSNPSVSSRARLQNSTTRRLEVERQVEQRFIEKQELLEQLKITTSLLDQFISIRDMSGQDMILPPFITDDLLAILTATSATLISTTQTFPPSIPLTTPSRNHHDTTRTTHTTTITPPRPPINYRALRSYDRPGNHDTSFIRLVDRMIGSPPYATRLQELELNIASVHHRVCSQLDRLGNSLDLSPRPSLSSFPTIPVDQSLSG